MDNKIISSLKWSTGAEVLAKIITPLVNMILARILAPESFGILATVNMIISFVDILTDSGFAKYIIQCDFKDEREKFTFINVAFWTNLAISVSLYLTILVFRDGIARMVGNPGYGKVISFAGIQIVITSFSTVHMSVMKREFEFKTLFLVRIITAIVPLFITVPLAYILRNHWALVIGTTCSQLITSIILVIKARWKPRLSYSFSVLHKMLSFSLWSLAEAISYWLITWIDIFIIGTSFSSTEVGLYKNSFNMVNSIMALVKASIIPVLFSTLSRLKNSPKEFARLYFTMQRMAAYALIPMGVGIFLFRNFVTLILFGTSWSDASNIVGAWGLASCYMISFISFNGEAYKSVGKPRTLFLSDLIYLFVLIPICLLSKRYGFWAFVYSRSISVIVEILIGFFFMKLTIGFSFSRMFLNVLKPTIASIVMVACGYLFIRGGRTFVYQIMGIIVCIIVYIGFCFLFYRKSLLEDYHVLKHNYNLES